MDDDQSESNDQVSLDDVDLYEDLDELFFSRRSVAECSLSYAEVSDNES